MKSYYKELWLNGRKRTVSFAVFGAVRTVLENPTECLLFAHRVVLTTASGLQG